jgi:hypothetical protein
VLLGRGGSDYPRRMIELDDLSPMTKALGLLVVRVAALETTLVELIVRIAPDTSGRTPDEQRARFTGRSGTAIVKELRRLGRGDVADAYLAIAEQRNHLVHGNGWELPDVGYHVKHSPPAQEGVVRLRERVWEVSEVVNLSRLAIELEKSLKREVREGGRLPNAYTVTGPIDDPWVPPEVKLPKPRMS